MRLVITGWGPYRFQCLIGRIVTIDYTNIIQLQIWVSMPDRKNSNYVVYITWVFTVDVSMPDRKNSNIVADDFSHAHGIGFNA